MLAASSLKCKRRRFPQSMPPPYRHRHPTFSFPSPIVQGRGLPIKLPGARAGGGGLPAMLRRCSCSPTEKNIPLCTVWEHDIRWRATRYIARGTHSLSAPCLMLRCPCPVLISHPPYRPSINHQSIIPVRPSSASQRPLPDTWNRNAFVPWPIPRPTLLPPS
ncbi:hypothetical protein LZ31DRAFT_273722 [Colletotrichum somersetense]|nr:hypothetical protein LZ31DRAFT_273722 [Colletotrichum somersetense]